jgi:hypothetical protein
MTQKSVNTSEKTSAPSSEIDSEPLTWILTDGTIGMQVQCLGLATAAGLTPLIKRIEPSWLLRGFPKLACVRGISAAAGGDPLTAPWPDVVISCGRRTAGAALAIRRMALSDPRNVAPAPLLAHIQDPRINADLFDLLVVPMHDPAQGPTVVNTLGSLNPHDPARLQEAAKRLDPAILALPQPRIAVSVGGSNKRYDFSPEAVDRFVSGLRHLAKTAGAALLVATSRRTDPATRDALRTGLSDLPGMVWVGEGENPYLGFLGLADAIVVTSDSVNMVSEACATGKPVMVATIEQETGRLAAFHERLRDAGLTRQFTGELEVYNYEPLNETGRVGELLAKRIAERAAHI